MEQRLSLVTLGVTDIDRARRFYEALGWSGESPDGEVYFFQAGGMILALWSRSELAADSVVTDGGGWGGVTLAHNVASPEAVDVVLAEAEAAGGTSDGPARPPRGVATPVSSSIPTGTPGRWPTTRTGCWPRTAPSTCTECRAGPRRLWAAGVSAGPSQVDEGAGGR